MGAGAGTENAAEPAAKLDGLERGSDQDPPSGSYKKPSRAHDDGYGMSIPYASVQDVNVSVWDQIKQLEQAKPKGFSLPSQNIGPQLKIYGRKVEYFHRILGHGFSDFYKYVILFVELEAESGGQPSAAEREKNKGILYVFALFENPLNEAGLMKQGFAWLDQTNYGNSENLRKVEPLKAIKGKGDEVLLVRPEKEQAITYLNF